MDSRALIDWQHLHSGDKAGKAFYPTFTCGTLAYSTLKLEDHNRRQRNLARRRGKQARGNVSLAA